MTETTARLALPLLIAGQGQKDVTHNEALVALDCLLNAVVESRVLLQPPTSPPLGRCWLVPAAPSGAWVGQTGLLACWTSGGWRFLASFEGQQIWVRDEQVSLRKVAAQWIVAVPKGAPAAALSSPTGGSTVDIEARQAIAGLLQRLVGLGLLTP